jgi:Na+/pantothenate symporter
MSLAIGSLAAIKIGQVIFGLSAVETLLWASVGVGIYATLGGLTGSIWADFFQYAIAMLGSSRRRCIWSERTSAARA